jgi:hypothetical protein
MATESRGKRVWKPFRSLVLGFEIHDKQRKDEEGAIEAFPPVRERGVPRELLFLPMFVVVVVKLVGLLAFDWSMISDGWPMWFTALFVLAVGSALFYAYLERRDREEAL